MAGKRARNVFPQIANFEHLHRSAWQARKGIKMNADLASFFLSWNLI